MNDWVISQLLNDIYKLQAGLAALRTELELEVKRNADAREVTKYAQGLIEGDKDK